MLAGITQRASEELDEMYERGGIKGFFDVAALQIFPRVSNAPWRPRSCSGGPSGATGMVACRSTSPSSPGLPPRGGRAVRYLAHETKRGMSIKLAQAYGELARRRGALGLARMYWYTWASAYGRGGNVFDYSGPYSPQRPG